MSFVAVAKDEPKNPTLLRLSALDLEAEILRAKTSIYNSIG